VIIVKWRKILKEESAGRVVLVFGKKDLIVKGSIRPSSLSNF
jgi:hypothetical protein